ncbi:MAG: hypothetical protein IJ058_05845 [Lachnospiraceae bacterium]|nr:hypothetical protein [Lachnospiraceae bacterium]
MKIASNEKILLNDIKKIAIKGAEKRIAKHVANATALLNIPTPDIYVIPYIASHNDTLVFAEKKHPQLQIDSLRKAGIEPLPAAFIPELNIIAITGYSIVLDQKYSDAVLLYSALHDLRMIWNYYNNPVDEPLDVPFCYDISYYHAIDATAFARLYTDFVYRDKPYDYRAIIGAVFAMDDGERYKRLEALKEEYGSRIEQLTNL